MGLSWETNFDPVSCTTLQQRKRLCTQNNPIVPFEPPSTSKQPILTWLLQVSAAGLQSRYPIWNKKRKKRTLTNTFLVVQNMFSVLEGMDVGMIVLTLHDWKKTNAVIGWRLQPPTKLLCCKFNCISAQRSYQNSRDHRRTGTEKSNEPPHMTSWQLVRLK